MRTPTTQTIFTLLKRTTCCVSVREFSQLISDVHRCARIAQTSPGQSLESGDLSRHLVEQAFDTHEAILSRDVENQFVEKLPFRARLALRFNGLQEFLHAAFGVRKCPALFCVGTTREKIM